MERFESRQYSETETMEYNFRQAVEGYDLQEIDTDSDKFTTLYKYCL
ncbi:MAG: hypothetical protein WD512_18045 [Candidatus Paceibacterota bacterium]